jgi:ribose transport system substrate-binding protein
MRSAMQKLAIFSLIFFALQLTGCQYRSKSDVYYLVAPNLKLSYWKTVISGFKQGASEYNVTAYEVGPDNYDPAAEADAFSKAVASKPAGILVSVADAGALRDDIASAISAGVPVITVDSDAPFSARLFFIGTNNVEVGHLGGKRLAEKLHGKGNVVFYSIPGQPNMDERMKGYQDILGENSGIRVVETITTRGDSNSAFDETEKLVKQTGPQKIDAFVCLDSGSAAAVAEVVKRAHLTDRVIIGMDTNQETLDLIQSGDVDSTVSQKPYTMGYLGLRALDEAHHSTANLPLKSSYENDPKSPFPAFVDTGTELITKDNVNLILKPEAK